ncbi:MAG: hydrogenase maturation protease [Candidatus Marinimicrobia bacterium]|nr:hydrogenase maturation protease [Candidatus Neomarinimicrobiota bacterium]
MTTLTVIGVGNRLRGDDAVGSLVIDALANMSDQDLELVDAGSDALSILEYLEGRQQVIIVDACCMGRDPGSVVSFDPAQAQLILDDDPMSLHGLGLAEALKIADSLEMLPESLKIIGIEPDSLQFKGTLSQPVQQALKTVVKKIQDVFKRKLEVIEVLPS